MAVDPDDLIFPRIATRIGPKFQANVGNAPTETAEALGIKTLSFLLYESNSHVCVGPEERGGSSTVEAMSLINQMAEEDGKLVIYIRQLIAIDDCLFAVAECMFHLKLVTTH